VALVGVPNEFVPLQVRCQPESLAWRDDAGNWRSVSKMGLLSLYSSSHMPVPMLAPREARDFSSYLHAKVEQNRAMSHGRRQHTLLLWVEPRGIEVSDILQLLVQYWELPIRVGQLPILPNEEMGNPLAPR
jgi:hypothetical protein